ncbi:MAG: hypothetical protein KKA65_04010 [Nanoarchaeota archaeon]|nr:hypothetical protein [Nanoarchaeota archaeon]MBU4242121.1 hypothetical protein [Nanoarchaeota archaeon]MBU4352239.1 hypothetical protein [Nanoarchaeota archaeon]MBU4456642.1 hypothetical protein [Nanoarchaeota archaeon]MCG2719196.1 hypothetical protein [Nanoarchaeota archaeon]
MNKLETIIGQAAGLGISLTGLALQNGYIFATGLTTFSLSFVLYQSEKDKEELVKQTKYKINNEEN